MNAAEKVAEMNMIEKIVSMDDAGYWLCEMYDLDCAIQGYADAVFEGTDVGQNDQTWRNRKKLA